jgi:hypothetical protein
MIGPVNLKFFPREMLSKTESSIEEARFKFPHEQHFEKHLC